MDISKTKLMLYVLVALVVGFIGYKVLGGLGALAGLGTFFGTSITKLKKQATELDTRATEIKKDIQEIEKKEVDLKLTGVPDKTANEEAEYWKKQ